MHLSSAALEGATELNVESPSVLLSSLESTLVVKSWRRPSTIFNPAERENLVEGDSDPWLSWIESPICQG